MKRKTLALFFLILVAGLIASRFLSRQWANGLFQSGLLKVDTTQVTGLTIQAPGRTDLFLTREDMGWLASDGRTSSWVEPSRIELLLKTLLDLEALELASQDRQEWTRYGVEPGEGTRVRVFSGNETLEDFWLGVVSPQGQSGSEKAFFRFDKAKDVFAIDASLVKPFRVSYEDYRDRKLFLLSMEVLPDSMEYLREDNHRVVLVADDSLGWRLAEGPVLDSAQFVQWWRAATRLEGSYFADNFDEMSESVVETRRIQIWFNQEEPFKLACYRDSNNIFNPPFVLHSNQYPNSFFSSDSGGVFQEVFLKLDTLVASARGVNAFSGSSGTKSSSVLKK